MKPLSSDLFWFLFPVRIGGRGESDWVGVRIRAKKGNKPGVHLIKPVLVVSLYDFRLLIPAVILVNYRKGETFVLLSSVPTIKLLLVNSATYWRLTLLLLIFARILTVPL
jgi:hypothetical protein